MKRIRLWSIMCLAIAVLSLAVPAKVYALTINTSPASATLLEAGGSQTITFSLSEPIIVPGPDPGYVTINLTNPNPGRLTLSAHSVTWAFTEWATPKAITVQAVTDSLDNDDASVTVSFLTDSNAEFYNNFAGSFAVTVVDDDEPAAVVASSENPQSSSVDQLASTGDDGRLSLYIFLGSCLLLGLQYHRYRRRVKA